MRKSDYVSLAAIALMPRLLFLWALPLASGTTDPNCAPDELAHFWVVREMSFGRFEPWSPGAFSIYSSFLPSQYVFQATTLAIGRFLGGDIVRFVSPEPLVVGYGYARLGSILLGLITVAALAQAAWTLTRSRLQSLVAGIVVALLPQLAFVNAYVNADSFTIAGGALLTCSLVCWILESRQYRNGILLGATLGFVFLGKLSGYYLLPPTAALIVLELRRQQHVRLAMPILAACLATAGPVILWNTARSGGDVFGLHAYQEFLAHHWTTNPAPGPAPWRLFFGSSPI
jgi:4-amino-4-deoxy-L-arabinose transferase-like glycosyltransferase